MADLKIGTTRPSKVYLGTTAVKKIYIGSTLVWSSGPTWAELFASFDYAPAGYSDAAEIGFDVYDNTVNSGDYSAFLILKPERNESEDIIYWDYYSKTTYASLLSDLSEFDFRGSYDAYDCWDMASDISFAYDYIVIPTTDGGGTVMLYKYTG